MKVTPVDSIIRLFVILRPEGSYGAPISKSARSGWLGQADLEIGVPLAAVSFRLVSLLLAACFALPVCAAELHWKKLAPIPDALGFAGSFAGVSGGALLVAGGANFPDAMPWEGGAKVWQDDVFVLEKPDGAWRKAGRLPVPLGYGVAVSHARGLVCIGGSSREQHHGSVIVLRWAKGRLETELLLGLPEACANMSGALIGDTVFVAGGMARPDSTNTLDTFYSMNLSAKRPGWRKLEPFPGPGRMLATAGAHSGSLYLFGGASVHPGPDGKPVRDWRRDAYRYTPGRGWKRIADLPRVAVAAPSPAPVWNGKLLVIGGDDGSQVSTPPTAHSGFPRSVLAYDPKKDQWEQFSNAPFALVTTAAVPWSQRIVIPGGEVRPGVRSTEVWSLGPK